MASRSIDDLDPRVREGARDVLRAWTDLGFTVLVTCTFRSNEEQRALYAKGRTAPGPKVTNARPGESKHNAGLALDFVPIVGGKLLWDGEAQVWEILARAAQMADPRVAWGGDFKSINDKPHIEWRLPKEGPDAPVTFAGTFSGGSTTA